MSIKGIPLIGLGYYYKRPRVYISALIVKQTFDSPVFAQDQMDSLGIARSFKVLFTLCCNILNLIFKILQHRMHFIRNLYSGITLAVHEKVLKLPVFLIFLF